jgi:hypothetical protein
MDELRLIFDITTLIFMIYTMAMVSSIKDKIK